MLESDSFEVLKYNGVTEILLVVSSVNHSTISLWEPRPIEDDFVSMETQV